MKRLCVILLVLLLPAITMATEATPIRLLPYEKNEFSPVHGQHFTIPLKLTKAGKVELRIHTPDGELIRTLHARVAASDEPQHLNWDGKDEQGRVVPDEAYLPVAILTTRSGERFVYDRRNTGGEVIEGLKMRITPDKNLQFNLPDPARLLVRAGIKGGPMLRSLANWEVKNKGSVIVRWNGYDQDGLMDIRKSGKLSIMSRAYRLPEHAIITHGNNRLTYRAYRKQLADKSPPPPPSAIKLERNGKRIEKHYYLPKDINLSPAITVAFTSDYPLNAAGQPILSCPCPIRVDIANPDDKAQLQQSLYEIGFFIDHEFVSEQEQGYVPLTWRWNPSGLAAGIHVLTVNVSGLRGEVGVKSLLFEIRQ